MPSVSYTDDGMLRCSVTNTDDVTFSWTISSNNFDCNTDDYCRLEREGDVITSVLTVNVLDYGMGQIFATCTVTVDDCPFNDSIIISVGGKEIDSTLSLPVPILDYI